GAAAGLAGRSGEEPVAVPADRLARGCARPAAAGPGRSAGFSGVALSADDLRVGAAEFRQPGCASSAGAAAGSASGARAAAVAPPVARTRRTGFVAGGGDPDHPHIAGADRRTIAGSGPPPLAVAGSIIVHRDRKRGSLRCKPPCAITLRSPRSPQ